jgi:hypothetical protein
VFSHAALVYRDVPRLAGKVEGLLDRAVRAWDHFHAHPKSAACDDGTVTGGDADRELDVQAQTAVVAAVYLFATTSEGRYGDYVKQHYAVTRPFQEDRWSAYDPEQGDALLFYTTLDDADAGVKKAILERKRTQARSSDVYALRPDLDLYRAYMRSESFHWGSNKVRANYGNTNYDVVEYALFDAAELVSFRDRAAGLLHAFHGVNPLQLVYLTNMGSFGAERSVNEMFHVWFRDADPTWDSAATSTLGPAPGYVVGGPNRQYCKGLDAREYRCVRSALTGQPHEKAFLDFNTGHAPELEHDRSWEITEPGIYYQSAYVKLLSKFVD